MTKLNVSQKIATLAGLSFQYNHRFTQKGKSDDRYLVYEAIEVSKIPYCVKIVNIGEKKTMDILSITLHPNKLEIKSEIKEEIGDKLTNKDIHDWGKHSITTHYRCVSLVVLPAMIEASIEATSANLVSPKWLFLSCLMERLKAEEQLDLTDKFSLKDFNQSDIAWSLTQCVQISERHSLPSVKLFKSELNKIPEDVRKPFETIDVDADEVPVVKHIEQVK